MPSIFDELPGFLELGAWTTRHIRPLFDLFRDEDVAPALALMIFGSALVLCSLFIIECGGEFVQYGASKAKSNLRRL